MIARGFILIQTKIASKNYNLLKGLSHFSDWFCSIWLPTESWADVFKFLSRRTLLKRVQPMCRHFHAIAEHIVDNVHVIRNLGYFIDGLGRDLPVAKKQKDKLVASNASLTEHFLLDESVRFCVERQTGYKLDSIKVYTFFS